MTDDDDYLAPPQACARPTRTTGEPCKARRVSRFAPACHTHLTEREAESAEVARHAYTLGWNSGRESGARFAAEHTQQLTQRVKELEAQLDAERHLYELEGDQLVEVDGYAYRWSGPDRLAVGDRVVLPQNWISKLKHGPGPFAGQVTMLGTKYRGDIARILRREKPAPADR